MDESNLHSLDGIRVGRVIAVSAAQVIALLEPSTAGAACRVAPVEMGALVKMRTRASTVYGMVNALRVPLPSLSAPDEDLKIVEIELLGEILQDAAGDYRGFQRGVSVFPAIEDCGLSGDDGGPDAGLCAGWHQQRADRHDSPESSSVTASLLHRRSDGQAFQHRRHHRLGQILRRRDDPARGHRAQSRMPISCCSIRTTNMPAPLPTGRSCWARGDGLRLPYWLFNFDELAEIVLGPARIDAEQRKILAEAVLAQSRRISAKPGSTSYGSVDTPVPYRMSDLVHYLDGRWGRSTARKASPPISWSRPASRRCRPTRAIGFMFGASLSMRDEMSEILAQLFRIPVNGKPITILDISGVPSEVLNVVVSVVCRLTFDFAMWSGTQIADHDRLRGGAPLCAARQGAGFEPVKRALSRIAKEGRKYGVSLCVVSQRPSDLAPSLLSECNTMFALRMTNQDDQDILRGALPEASHGLMEFLPALRNGEAIVVGEGVSMPMRICFAPLPEECRPKSSTASFSGAWSQDVGDRSAVDETVDRWRRGMRNAA